MMERIIKISEETFKYYVTLANKGEQIGNLERIILDSTPLPEHYGRLIDADCLREDFKASKKISFAERMDISCIVDHAPTIIERSDSEWHK